MSNISIQKSLNLTADMFCESDFYMIEHDFRQTFPFENKQMRLQFFVNGTS